MTQIVLELDEETARRLKAAAAAARASEADWVAEAVRERLATGPAQLSEGERRAALERAGGAWEDDRSVEEILAEIRSAAAADRPPLDEVSYRRALRELAGSWSDDRSPEEILADVRDYPPQGPRVPLD